MFPLLVVKLKELSPDTMVGGSTNITSEPTGQPAVPQEQRLHITDRISHIRFLVDSGSVVSVIPRTLVRQKTTLSDLALYAANQTVIHTYGKYVTQLNSDLRRNFTWPFIIADVHTAIIGADFLSKFQLLIDLKNQRLIDSVTGLSTPAFLAQAKHISVSTVQCMSKFQKLLSEFVDVTKPSIKAATQHDVRHYIETKGIPVADRPRRLSGEKLVTAKREINFLIEQGICLARQKVLGPARYIWLPKTTVAGGHEEIIEN